MTVISILAVAVVAEAIAVFALLVVTWGLARWCYALSKKIERCLRFHVT
jgi:hypothetical protein